ncbi:MAG: M1 family peptidase, partial [Gemmatimonadaceae bacterium]|nr:M1 family peptidase [Chitinophagaceae bacterium]
GIDSVWEEAGKTKIRLINSGQMPMPVDLQVSYSDGSSDLHYVPMYLMFGAKPIEDASVKRTVYAPWKWTHPTYVIEVPRKLSEIAGLEVDPSQRMADVNRSNNKK